MLYQLYMWEVGWKWYRNTNCIQTHNTTKKAYVCVCEISLHFTEHCFLSLVFCSRYCCYECSERLCYCSWFISSVCSNTNAGRATKPFLLRLWTHTQAQTPHIILYRKLQVIAINKNARSKHILPRKAPLEESVHHKSQQQPAAGKWWLFSVDFLSSCQLTQVLAYRCVHDGAKKVLERGNYDALRSRQWWYWWRQPKYKSQQKQTLRNTSQQRKHCLPEKGEIFKTKGRRYLNLNKNTKRERVTQNKTQKKEYVPIKINKAQAGTDKKEGVNCREERDNSAVLCDVPSLWTNELIIAFDMQTRERR